MAEQSGGGLNRKFAGAGGGGAAYGAPVTTQRAAFWSVMVQMRATGRMVEIMGAAEMVATAVAAPAQTARPESRQTRVQHQRAFFHDPDNGTGGTAGAAGHGKAGCILVYYRRPVPTYAGAFVESGGHFLVRRIRTAYHCVR